MQPAATPPAESLAASSMSSIEPADQFPAMTYSSPWSWSCPESSQRTQEVDQILLALRVAHPEAVKIIDDFVSFGVRINSVAKASVKFNRLHDILRAPIVKEEVSLPDTP